MEGNSLCGTWRKRRVSTVPQLHRDIKKRCRQPYVPYKVKQPAFPCLGVYQVFLTTIRFFVIYADCRWGENFLCLPFLRNPVIAEGNKTFIYKHPAVFKMRLLIIFSAFGEKATGWDSSKLPCYFFPQKQQKKERLFNRHIYHIYSYTYSYIYVQMLREIIANLNNRSFILEHQTVLINEHRLPLCCEVFCLRQQYITTIYTQQYTANTYICSHKSYLKIIEKGCI